LIQKAKTGEKEKEEKEDFVICTEHPINEAANCSNQVPHFGSVSDHSTYNSVTALLVKIKPEWAFIAKVQSSTLNETLRRRLRKLDLTQEDTATSPAAKPVSQYKVDGKTVLYHADLATLESHTEYWGPAVDMGYGQGAGYGHSGDDTRGGQLASAEVCEGTVRGRHGT